MNKAEEMQWMAGMLEGYWKLLSAEFTTQDGTTLKPFGETPLGEIIFRSMIVIPGEKKIRGYFSAQLMNPLRQRFASDTPTPDEALMAYIGYTAYYGITEIRGKNFNVTARGGNNLPERTEGTVINHVKASLNPNWIGSEQVRYFDFKKGFMTLRTPVFKGPFDLELSGTLDWEKK